MLPCWQINYCWYIWWSILDANLYISLLDSLCHAKIVLTFVGSSLDLAFTADNVAERDYLRTEGDPGAVGYTIKEALALTRSVVSGILCSSFVESNFVI